MDDIKFSSVTDLYKRLYPALSAKKNELAKDDVVVSELDIWNHLRQNKWNASVNLKLYNMVEDIFNISSEIFGSERK